MSHIPVLLNESIDGLNLKNGDTFYDATLGGAGHSGEVSKRFGNKLQIIGTDHDCDAIDRARNILGEKAVLECTNFGNVDQVFEKNGISGVDGAIFDLGLSSFQLDESGRGFTFKKSEPLMMTMKKDPSEEDITASDIVNQWSEETLADIIYAYGEERYSRRIARAIVEARTAKKIENTEELSEIIKNAVPKKFSKIHPATKTFQALRIVVNKELDEIKTGIKKTIGYLKPNGRIAVISFHSLEDRIVKDIFRTAEDEGLGKRVTKKPITPTMDEIKLNPKSRSAKLRIFEKI